MQAILLAGGLGTRLRSVVSDRPKPMALIENRPFMEYVVHELSKYGVTDIILQLDIREPWWRSISGTERALRLRTECL